MSDFNVSFKKVMKNEGGYGNDPDDVGGETYRGISRKYNPSWEGWKLIDKHSTTIVDIFEELDNLVKKFYRQHYWEKLLCDRIDSQNLVDELFDTAVNMGVYRSSLFFQQALNYLNRNEKLYDDIVEDGRIGNNTLNVLLIYLSNDNEKYILKIMNILQGMHYLSYMKKSKTQEKYVRGWLNRVEIGGV